MRQNFEITEISTKVSYFSYFGGKLARKLLLVLEGCSY